jgi:hypothetical protein
MVNKLTKPLFRIRSELSHGFRDPFIIDLAIGYGLHPDKSAEQTQGWRAPQTARLALYKWLHTPEPTT